MTAMHLSLNDEDENPPTGDFKPSRRPFTGRRMLAMIVGFFAVIFVMNGIMAYIAVHTFSGEVVDDSFQASQSYNKVLSKRAMQAQLGWRAAIEVTETEIVASFLDAEGTPLRALDVRATVGRPASDKEDAELPLHANGRGGYHGELSLSAGAWLIQVHAVDRDGHSFAAERRVTVRP